MITKFEKYTESIKSLLVGPTKEEMWDNLMSGKLKGLITSIPESPEEFFNQMKDGCIKIGKHNDFIYFGKNDVKLFLQDSKNKLLGVGHNYIWSVLEKIYGLDYLEIKSLIKSRLLDDTKWNKFTPEEWYWDVE